MSELKSIIKYELINRLSLNKIFKATNIKRRSILGIIVAIILGIFSLVTCYMYSLYTVFAELGCAELILLIGMALASFICFITNIPMCESTIFHSRDYEFLMSMPIKTKYIITSKIFTLLIINYFTMASITLCSIFVLVIYKQIVLLEVFITILVLLVMPFFPLGISLIVSYFFTKLLSKFKHRNFIVTLLYLLFIVGIMCGTKLLSNLDDASNGYELILSFSKKISYISYLGYMGIKGNIISLVIYFLVSIILFVLFYYLLTKNYCRINSNLLTMQTTNTFKLDENKSKLNLVKLEFKKYFSLPGYVLNTICGPFMGCIMLVMLRLQDLDLSIIQIGDDNYSTLLIMGIISMFTGLNPITASTISLEGNKLWIYKSMPINPEKIFNSKVIVAFVANTFFLLCDCIILIFLWRFTFLDCFLIFVASSLYNLFVTYLGLYINLRFPKLDWINPIKIVKNSLAVFISMIAGFVLYISLIIISLIFVLNSCSQYFIFIFIMGLLVLLVFVIYKVTYTKGVQLWKNLH